MYIYIYMYFIYVFYILKYLIFDIKIQNNFNDFILSIQIENEIIFQKKSTFFTIFLSNFIRL